MRHTTSNQASYLLEYNIRVVQTALMMFAFGSLTASVPIHYRVNPLQHIFCISQRKKVKTRNLNLWHLKGSSDALSIHVVESFFLFYAVLCWEGSIYYGRNRGGVQKRTSMVYVGCVISAMDDGNCSQCGERVTSGGELKGSS